MKKKYTIKDIAQLAGVSVATVSRVLNNNGRFSEETRKKVVSVIKETGYKMNYSAKNLRMNRSFSIGLLVPDINNYFFANIVQKVEEILFTKGYSTIICNTGRKPDKESSYLQMLEGAGVDGLIVISGVEKFDLSVSVTDPNIPYICIDREPLDKQNTVFVSSNHYQGAFEAADQLIKNGSISPIFIGHDRKSPVTKERLEGFRAALRKNNITWHNERVLKINFNKEDAHQKLKQYLYQYPEADGIFALNDSIALELLTYFDSENICIPESIRIIGFDDIPYDRYVTPKLSSVQQNTNIIAKKSVESLLNLIDGKPVIKNEIIVPVKLILRDSCM